MCLSKGVTIHTFCVAAWRIRYCHSIYLCTAHSYDVRKWSDILQLCSFHNGTSPNMWGLSSFSSQSHGCIIRYLHIQSLFGRSPSKAVVPYFGMTTDSDWYEWAPPDRCLSSVSGRTSSTLARNCASSCPKLAFLCILWRFYNSFWRWTSTLWQQ